MGLAFGEELLMLVFGVCLFRECWRAKSGDRLSYLTRSPRRSRFALLQVVLPSCFFSLQALLTDFLCNLAASHISNSYTEILVFYQAFIHHSSFDPVNTVPSTCVLSNQFSIFKAPCLTTRYYTNFKGGYIGY